MLTRFPKSLLTSIHPYIFNKYHPAFFSTSPINNKLIESIPMNEYLKRNLLKNNLHELK